MGQGSQIVIRKNWAGHFFTIWIGQAFSILGSKLVSFALVWWLTTETGSAAVLATSTIMIYLPQIFLGPFAGALVDRWNRRRVMILSDSFVAAATLLLGLLFWAEVVQIWHIYLLVFIRSLGGSFHFPAIQASTTLMVPEKHLARIAGINQMMEGGIHIAGPALGALLMGLLPIQGVIAVDVITAAVAVTTLFFIPIPQPKNGKEKQPISPRVVLDDVVEGFKFLTNWKGLVILLSMAVFLNFIFAPAGSFIPLLVTEHFKGGVWQLGILESISGIGMLGGGLLLSIWGGFRKRVYSILLGMGMMGAASAVVGFVPEDGFVLATISFGVQGIFNTISNGSAFALIQSIVAPDMQGRVFSLLSSITSAISPLGLILAAPIVDHLGIQSWYIIAGCAAVIMCVVALLMPVVVHLEDQKGLNGRSMTDGYEGASMTVDV